MNYSIKMKMGHTWRRNARCCSPSVTLSLHLIISVLVLVATPNSIGALRPKYKSSIPKLLHDHQARAIHQNLKASSGSGEFVKTSGHQFTSGSKALYVNGANIYWLMNKATDESSRSTLREVVQEAAGVGVTVFLHLVRSLQIQTMSAPRESPKLSQNR